MKLFNKFKIIESYPALWIEDLRTVVVSDFHLGLEALMTTEGLYFPKFQLKEMKQDLQEILSNYKPERLIINGDIKHEFSKATWKERQEVQNLIDFLSQKVKAINLVKGNHDNYLIYVVQDYDNLTLKEKFSFKDILFVHGHQEEIPHSKYVILGHEHPALALKDKAGAKEKIRCFLYGEVNNKKLIVMPAFSKLAEGSPVNQIPSQELLSPWLKKVGVEDMKAVGVSKEGGLFEFPEIRKINHK